MLNAPVTIVSSNEACGVIAESQQSSYLIINSAISAISTSGAFTCGVSSNEDGGSSTEGLITISPMAKIYATTDGIISKSVSGTNILLMAGSKVETATPLSGGHTVVTGIGDDSITSGSVLIGDVDVSDGDDILAITDGSVDGSVLLGAGEDTLLIAGPTDVSKLKVISGDQLDVITLKDLTMSTYTSATTDLAMGTNLQGLGALMLDSTRLTLTGDVTASEYITNGLGSTASIPNSTTVTTDVVTNSGTIDLRATSGILHTATVTGNYVGDNGRLGLNVALSGSDIADVLHVAGSTSGQTEISLTIVSGNGALTTGKGILLVEVDGISASDAFSLTGGYIDNNGYRYTLVHDDSDGNWYLRSAALLVPPTVDPITPPATEVTSSPGYTLSKTGVNQVLLTVVSLLTILGAIIAKRLSAKL